MTEQSDVIVIGAGQAGLAMSYYLRQIGREHVVLERARIVERWRSERWDSLTFQFPNWALALPGRSYGGDPNAFAHRDEVVRFLEDYAAFVEAPVRCGIEVTSLRRKSGSANYLIETTNGVLEARAVVIATGPFQRPRIPDLAARIPADVTQIHASRYNNPEQLRPGSVLVVGAGASGCQIAEELHQAGRAVYFSISRHRRVPRKFRGKYVLAWLLALGYVDQSLEMFSGARIPPPMVFTGVGGGHDIDLRQFAADGVRLLGTFLDVAGSRLTFSDDVESILQAADATDLAFRAEVDEYVRRSGLSLPNDVVTTAQNLKARPTPAGGSTLDLNANGITSIIWCTGYNKDFGWVKLPVFDPRGNPVHTRGVSACQGVYFLGLQWMHKWRSAFLFGVGNDAAYLAAQMARK